MEPKVETPTRPTQRECNAAAPGSVSFGASPRRSSAVHGGAGGGGGGAPLPFGHDAPASGTVAFDEWKVRATALRKDAKELLSKFPRRKKGGEQYFDPNKTEEPWVYSYLLFDEPLQLGRSGGIEIAGARGLAAADEGALFTATFGVVGAPDEANVRLRLFVELAPKWITSMASALGRTAAEAAAADCPLATGVSDGAESPQLSYLELETTPEMPNDADAKEMAIEVDRLRELPHERAGLLSFAPPRDGLPAALLRVSLGTKVPTTAPREMVVFGRLLDGQKELAHLADRGRKSAEASASAGMSGVDYELRLLRFHETPNPASAPPPACDARRAERSATY